MSWLRVAAYVGGVLLGGGLAFAGCNKCSRDEPRLPRPPSTPSNLSPPPVPPLVPSSDISSQYIPPRPSVAIECQHYRAPALMVNVEDPKRELRQLRQEVIPALNRHAARLNQRDYTSVAGDMELSRLLLSLQGARIYLKEGAELALDTESDVLNIYAAYEWLNWLDRNRPNSYDPNSRPIYEAWTSGTLIVAFNGFWFRDHRVPHRSNYRSDGGTSEEYNRFRIVHPVSFREFPDFADCNVPLSVVYGWGTRE